MRTLAVLWLVLASTTAYALPPGTTGLREGANHRVGDDSFVDAFHREPTDADGEALRMRTHLAYVRVHLAATPATADKLADKRRELLGYLGDYIAKGSTPQNTHLPWRTPVFIDDFGNICAVGYLIERSAGRDLAEAIAKAHRYDYLEDIAAAMPEVRAWIDASGFTLDELASIQPGYMEPAVESWVRWDLAKKKNGPFKRTMEYRNIVTKGTIKRGHMEGAWTVSLHGKVLGKGTLHRGDGTWTSFDLDGKRIGEGPFVADDPHGRWTLFHPSGNVAAVGRFSHGYRDGSWEFFNDTSARTPIAKGRFAHGSLAGTWRHFDANGVLLATSRAAPPPHRDDFGWPYLLALEPDANGVRQQVHTTGGVDSHRLDLLSYRGEKIYAQHLYEEPAALIDDGGNLIEKIDGVWRTGSCNWSKKRKSLARAGDLTTLHGLVDRNARDEGCQEATAKVSAARAKKLDVIVAAMKGVRTPKPAFVKQLALGLARVDQYRDDDDSDAKDDDTSADDEEENDTPADLRELLASGMGWYVEWPHIDGRFIQLFHSTAGYGVRDLSAGDDGDSDDDETEAAKTADASPN